MLDGVGAGLVEGVAAGDVGCLLGGGPGAHVHAGAAETRQALSVGSGAMKGEGRADLVRATAQLAQHAPGVGGVGGLAERLLAIDDQRVGGQDERGRCAARGDDGRLRLAETRGPGARLLTGQAALVQLRRVDRETQLQRGQQFAPPRRGGSQHKAGVRVVGPLFPVQGGCYSCCCSWP